MPRGFAWFPAQLSGPPGDVHCVSGPLLPATCHAAVLQGLAEHGHQDSQWHVIPGRQEGLFALLYYHFVFRWSRISVNHYYYFLCQVVPRALCAKNILVGTGMDVKIYNIGAFDFPIDTGDDLTKWMAPETLFDGTNMTYSDV